MSHYRYSPLSLGSASIRLLRLMPHRDEKAPIQCKLFEYSFQEPSKGVYLYEALSYVWGSLEPPKFISIGTHNLRVTENLHIALSHLRDCSFERIIWVDSICINQADTEEKARQIQSMARIYGQANRVIVYLGQAAHNSDQALEDIRTAAEDGPTNSSISEKSQDSIFKLLERPWFRRIWVLQEVALARRILIMCGSAEMNGYTFCSGLNKLELSYKDHPDPDLQSLIRSVTYLIRGAIFRPKYALSPSSGLSLGELIDMYHTHKATEHHDKVYALLGMSSDDPSAAGLSPDYNIPWKELLQRLIEVILFKGVSIKTWNEKDMAVIKSKGCILGQVSSVESDSARYDRQHVNVVFNNTPRSLEYERECGDRWTLQASAKPIWKRDSICLLEGASKPSIIRAYRDHFAIIMMAVTLRQSVRTESGYAKRQKSFASAKNFSHDFLLVWNWEKPKENLKNRAKYEEYEASGKINILVPDYLNTASDEAARSCDVALVLGDSTEYEAAGKRLQEAIEAFGKENSHTLAATDGLALIYKRQQQWTKAQDLFLQVIQTRKLVKGIDDQDTLSSIANLVSTYISQGHSSSWKQEMMISLTDRIRDNAQIKEEDVVQVAASFGKELITLLLDLKRDNVPVTEAVVKAAAGNEGHGKEVMALLLDKRSAEVQITTEVVKQQLGTGAVARR